MIRFCQPSDYRWRSRSVWFNPADVTSITTPEDVSHDECLITLRDGRCFIIGMSAESAAMKLNAALKEANEIKGGDV